MTEELQDALARAETLPYGKGRNRALEAVAQRADGVDLDIAFEARVLLAHAYTMGGERRKMPIPFAWCLAEWDKDPARFGHHRLMLLWAFKFVPSTLIRFPELSLEMARSTLDDMERRYRQAGQSMHAVHMSRHLVARHVGDEEEAAEQLRLWLAAPRDDLSDCLGCCPSHQVEYLTQRGRYAEAVALARPVLAGTVTCSEQPQEMQATALEAMVAEGLLEDAAQAHRASYRRHRGRAAELEMISQHVRFCACTGNEVRALEIVDAHLPLIDDADSPHARMEFAAAAAHALTRIEAIDSGLTVRTREGRVPVGHAAAELAALATELGARFDERNGTTSRGARVQRVLTREPWIDYLPLSQTAARAHSARERIREQQEARGTEAPADGPAPVDLSELPIDELLDAADAAWWDRAFERAGAAWDAWDAGVSAGRRTPVESARLAEGRALQSWVADDFDAALEQFRAVLVQYDEVGDDHRSARTRARISSVLAERGEIEEALITGEAPLRNLIENDVAHRAVWGTRLARLFLLSDRAEDADAVLRGVVDEELSGDSRLAHLFLSGDIAVELEKYEEAVDRYSAVVDAVDDGPARIMPLWQRGRAHLAMGAAASAVDDLIEAVALLSTVDQMNPGLQADLAEAYLRVGDAESAAHAAEEAIGVLDDADRSHPRARLLDVLVRANEVLGDWDNALDRVRLLLPFAVDNGEPGWHLHLLDQEANFLENLERWTEAVSSWSAGAGLASDAGWPLDAVRFWRCAAGAAIVGEDPERAAALLDAATSGINDLDPADPGARFHRAGISVQRAEIALGAGRHGDALQLAAEAQAGFLAVGEPGAAAGAVLLRLDAGADVPAEDLRGLWDQLEPDSNRWYQLGYRLADALRDEGADSDADAVEGRLEQE